MKQKPRHRKVVENGKHTTTTTNGKYSHVTNNVQVPKTNKISLELLIFRTCSVLLLVILSVYAVYSVFYLPNRGNLNEESKIKVKSTVDDFVELEADESSDSVNAVYDSESDPIKQKEQHSGDHGNKIQEESIRTETNKKVEMNIKPQDQKQAKNNFYQSPKSSNNVTEQVNKKKKSENTKKIQQLNSSGSDEDAKLKQEIEKFQATYLKTMSPKKIFVDGRRLPPVELLPQKPNNSSVRVFLYDQFLSEQECDGLMKAHNSHVTQTSKQDPIICFDTIDTLRKHLRAAKKKIKVSPADFISGTYCVNQTFSLQLKHWLKSNWSYSTAFYRGESRFSHIFEHRVKEATKLLPENGGKFQITSYPQGIGYKTHTDCVEDNADERDRVATILVYLQDVEDGGETKFPELGIWVKPRKGRALVWNNMNEDGKCEPLSVHNAAKVNKGHKYILQRWYYYKSFYSLGKRPPEPQIPVRPPGTPRVNCDEYEKGSCRWYDEWNYEHIVDYRTQRLNLI